MNRSPVKNIVILILEPIALGLLALLFIIPTITVVNLQPITKKIQEINVLGAANKSGIQVNIVGGTHQIFRDEHIEEKDGIYTYTTELLRRDSDSYSKPILEIKNGTETDVNIEINGGTQIPTGSNIGLIVGDQIYRLQEQNGDTVTQRITVSPNEKHILYLSVESFSDVQFQEEFTLDLKVLK